MKLRIKGNSLRLRVSPSELKSLLNTGHIEETIHFAPAQGAELTYALELSDRAPEMVTRYQPQRVTVVVPSQDAQAWAGSDQVGIYGSIPAGDAQLEVAVEKDFACLDKADGDNYDAFPNPRQGAVC